MMVHTHQIVQKCVLKELYKRNINDDDSVRYSISFDKISFINTMISVFMKGMESFDKENFLNYFFI